MTFKTLAAFVLGAVMCGGGMALAGGGSRGASMSTAPVLATYQCQGGLQVQVRGVPGTGTVQVQFAGRTQVLHEANGGLTYQNTEYAWVTQGATSSMRERDSGRVALRGCVAQ